MLFTARNLLRPELAYYPDVILEFLNAVTGAEYSPDERVKAVKAGERILNAERMFFIKAGFSRKDDALPPRLTREPLTEGPTQGQVVHLAEMPEEYYRERGWSQDGIPTESKLKERGLK